MRTGSRTVKALTLIAVLLVVVSACGTKGDDKLADTKSRDASPTTSSSTATTDAGSGTSTTPSDPTVPDSSTTTAPSKEPVRQEPNPACRRAPDRKITDLPDMTIPAVEESGTRASAKTIGGYAIPAVDVPGFRIPEQVVDGGCVIEHAAPGGCLGAVTVTGVTIPAGEIPGYDLEPVVIDGTTKFSGDHIARERHEAVSTPAVRTPQVCREKADKDTGFQPALFRPAVFRPAVFRPTIFRPAGYRGYVCPRTSTECTEPVRIDSVLVDSVRIDSVRIDSVYVESRTLPKAPDTKVYKAPAGTSYVTPAEVLFDFGKADLRPEAIPVLQAITTQLREATGKKITVEGHTDSVGTPQANQDLSERRARAVSTWLTTTGGLPPASVTTRGYGESVPAVPNTKPDGSDDPAGRAKNRRVVITTRS